MSDRPNYGVVNLSYPSVPTPPPRPAPVQTAPAAADDVAAELEPVLEPEPAPISAPTKPDESLAVVDDRAGDQKARVAGKIRAFGVAEGHKAHEWKRQVNKTGAGAVRIRSFHGRLSDQGLDYMDDAINEWLEKHPEIEVKFVTSTVGLFDGKIKELAIILNVWY
ncbi:MAG: hypothetical protein ACREIT_01525 [Tepidisphaeraceae bacterium]